MNPKNTSVSPELDDYWGDPTGGAEIETSLADYESRAYKSPEFFINKDVVEFKNDFQNYLEAKKTHVSKFTLPFTQTNEGCVGRPIDFEFRPGELTVLAGENGSGKSLLLGQIGLHLISCGASLYIASFEMAPVRTIERMLMQTVCSQNKRKIEAPDVDLFFRQFASKMRICDLQRKVAPNELLRLLDSAVHDYQSNILFVDSLMMCVRDDMDKKETDYVMTKLSLLGPTMSTLLLWPIAVSAGMPAQKLTPSLILLQKIQSKGAPTSQTLPSMSLSWLVISPRCKRRRKEKMSMTPSLILF